MLLDLLPEEDRKALERVKENLTPEFYEAFERFLAFQMNTPAQTISLSMLNPTLTLMTEVVNSSIVEITFLTMRIKELEDKVEQLNSSN